MRASALVIGLLLLGTYALAGAPTAEASCSIPCGYISPVLILELEDGARGKIMELQNGGGPIELDGTATFRFDIVQEGFGAHDPSNPISVTLSFTRKPAWLEAQIEPRVFEVPIQPQYIEEDTSDPTQPQAHYEYTQDISLTLTKNDLPIVIEDQEYEFSRMGLYARSTESGLYKPAYGYRELRVKPVGYEIVHDPAQVEGVFADVPLGTRTADDMAIPFHNVALDMDLLTEISLWKPTEMVFKVTDRGSGQAVRHPDMWVSVVDETGDVVYHSGFRHPHNGLLELDYTFPDVGRYTLLVGARPTPSLSRTFWEPVTASFPVVVERFGQPSYPDSYNATFYEPLQVFAGDPQAEHQLQKTIPFPVKAGAESIELTGGLTGRAYVSPKSPPTFPSEVTVAVLDPSGETVEQTHLTPASRSLDLSLEPSSTGTYKIQIQGTGIHPASYGIGATLYADLQVRYADTPEITKPNAQHPEPGVQNAESGPVTFSLDAPKTLTPWKVADLSASVDAPGRLRDLIVTVSTDDGRILYTDHLAASGDQLDLGFPFPYAGRYLVTVTAEPLPGTGASWQTRSAAFPVLVGDPAEETVSYPSTFETTYRESIDGTQGDTGQPRSQYDRYLPFPVVSGAERVEARVALEMPSAAVLEVELLDENGTRMAEGEIDPSQPEATLSPNPIRPGDYVVHVSGTDVAGASYTVDVGVGYDDDGPVLSNPLYDEGESALPDTGAALPGFQIALVVAAAAVALLLGRQRS